MKIERLKKIIFLHLAHFPMKSRKWRPTIVKWGGVNVVSPTNTFIGEDVIFDTNRPEYITIEEGVRITARCIILTHFNDSSTGKYLWDRVTIKKGAHIGVNTIICKPVTIGENAIVGAGSIVTKNIPANEVWAGNPAKFIKKRSY